MLNTPILFLIFNRPYTTEKVFEKIKQIKPKYLYVAADGPRSDRPEDTEKCRLVREIATRIDWDCKLKTRFQDINLGCKIGVSSAITWFFDHVEEGIILEDDCLPDLSFFNYCEVLLKKYRNNARIMHIGANNFQKGEKWGFASYYFSIYPHIWGWATWRRAWKLYDVNMVNYEHFTKNLSINKLFKLTEERIYWSDVFDKTIRNQINTWDYQWVYTCINNGLSITPNVNLIKNIGFTDEGTHTIRIDEKFELSTTEITKIVHPLLIRQNKKADLFTFVNIYYWGVINSNRNYLKEFYMKFYKIFFK